MVLGMSMSVFADGATATDPASATPTTYAITVDTSDDAVTHTYKVYQIFTGTPSDGKLTAIKYGSSYAGKTAGADVPKAELDAIGTTSDSVRTWIANTFGNGAANVGPEVATLNDTTTSYDAVPGYYLVLDTEYTATDATADAYSAFMIQVVDKATEFTPKKEVPSVDKEVPCEFSTEICVWPPPSCEAATVSPLPPLSHPARSDAARHKPIVAEMIFSFFIFLSPIILNIVLGIFRCSAGSHR